MTDVAAISVATSGAIAITGMALAAFGQAKDRKQAREESALARRERRLERRRDEQAKTYVTVLESWDGAVHWTITQDPPGIRVGMPMPATPPPLLSDKNWQDVRIRLAAYASAEVSRRQEDAWLAQQYFYKALNDFRFVRDAKVPASPDQLTGVRAALETARATALARHAALCDVINCELTCLDDDEGRRRVVEPSLQPGNVTPAP